MIRPSHFEQGGEVDCLARYEGVKRLSIRRPEHGSYEVYVMDYRNRKEEVLLKGSLSDCVAYTNRLTGYKDTVEKEFGSDQLLNSVR